MKDPSNPGVPRGGAADDEPPDRSRTRRLRIDPDSPYADALSVYSACDRAQLAAWETTASLFLTDVIAHLDLLNSSPEFPYRHASLTETARRHARAHGSAADWVSEVDPDPAPVTAAGDCEAAPASASDPFAAAPLPGFPKFRETQTIYGWVHSLSHAEDIAELSAIRGSTIPATYAHVTAAMTLVHGLPKFYARCLAGEFTIEHAIAATRMCQDLQLQRLPVIDCYLEERRADITVETFRKSLSLKVSIVQPEDERTQQAHERRRVGITTYPDGTACLTLTGPSAELQACYLRIEAFARAIRNGSTAAFADQMPAGAIIDDDRSIDALMFDILTRTIPQARIHIRAHDTDTGQNSTRYIPLDLENARTVHDIAEAINAAVGSAGIDPAAPGGVRVDEGEPATPAVGTLNGAPMGTPPPTAVSDAFGTAVPVGSAPAVDRTGPDTENRTAGDARSTDDDGPEGSVRSPDTRYAELTRIEDSDPDEQGRYAYYLGLTMPTTPFWLGGQAKLITTVPAISLAGLAELPGTFSDGSPIPPDMARAIAGQCSTWTRILTDPATGTPIDAKAMSYYIPAQVRQTLVAQWRWCSVPGCRRRAETSEVDHIIPFDHGDPASGGLTVFGNLHPLCKLHHQAKTDCSYAVRMDCPGVLEYRFAHGVEAILSPGDNPVDVEQARLMQAIETGAIDSDDEQEPPPSPGDERFADECPGPAAGDGAPGWVHAEGSIIYKEPRKKRWVWDPGGPPPF